MNKMRNRMETRRRLYWTVQWGDLWSAYWQPKNPKTGKPWQACREIRKGKDAYQLSNYITHVTQAPVIGPNPPFEVWSRLPGAGIARGYSTEALAIAAIRAEITKSGK